ncbi:hillarin-like [Ylistrum balloti]|uniref:hillarin-like n=1 Tax=Ylistrum balloti TaxID=509963 RepID=UPI0029059FD2|nr:hillarin-like [Ylistrum balloti]
MATASDDRRAAERGYQSLSSLFRPLPDSSNDCYRCSRKVYMQEKIGPVHDVVFHKNCFKCFVCGQFLNIRSYWSNATDSGDKEVYCNTHAPRIGAPKLGPGALGIKNAMDAQKGYQKMSKKLKPEVREAGTLRIPSYGMQAVEVQRAVSVPKTQKVTSPDQSGPQFGKDALHIKGPIDAQLLMKGNQLLHEKHHYPPNIYKKRKNVLLDAQKRLEEEHRREEDLLLEQITQNRRQEIRRISDELNMEWQVKLKDLTEKFEREMDKKKKKIKDSEKKQMTMHFENQRKDLEVTINEKRNRKRESMTMRIREKEQKVTSTMVARQSKQMLQLLAAKKEEIKQEIVEEIAQETNGVNGHDEQEELVEEVIEALGLPATDLPPPNPPSCRKKELYEDVGIFNELDEDVIKVAENEQCTYTELVQQLTENLKTDLEKVRALYRWVTVKDLNIIDFEETLGTDNPMGLLRGIKFGTETYHVLFMRLCSYAGLHCVEIKGHSKSVGYEPGMKIQPDTFQNTWNAVLIDGDWRLIQCNWGARHLVLNKDKNKAKEKSSSKDQIRYQYDEHYFLTDPDEFIQEFWSREPEWQLLENPITLEEFEALPFVRSVFFHFGMRFDHGMTAVLDASAKGGCDIKLKIPESLENDLVFYYQLRFAEKEKRMEATYRGSSLERFVFQTMIHNTVMFSIHLPTTGDFFFEIFANKIEESNRFGNSEDSGSGISPFRLKCACKFKVSCPQLSGKMHPLPDCASGEWGPLKGKRHFGIHMKQLRHLGKTVPENSTVNDNSDKLSDSGSSESGLGDAPDNPKAGIINVEDGIELYAKIPRPLHFVAKLKSNVYESKVLDPFVHSSVEGDTLKVRVSPPQTGQFGLDVYARPKEASESTTLSHAFKFLLNCVKVSKPVDLPRMQPKQVAKKEKWGPTAQFEEFGLKVLSHKEPKIYCSETNQCTIDILVPSKVTMSFQFLKEPDEEKNELVSMVKDDADPQKTRFFVNAPVPGNYMLSLFATKKGINDQSFPNVYNFLVVHKKSPKELNGTAKPEERKPSSIFRKNLFKKSDKDKNK